MTERANIDCNRSYFELFGKLAAHHGLTKKEMLAKLITDGNERISGSLKPGSPECRKYHKPVEPASRMWFLGQIIPDYRYFPETLPQATSRKT
jgi:hypothetical protein